MKVLDEYFLMVVFTLLLNRVHVFANFIFNLNRETWQWMDKTQDQVRTRDSCTLLVVIQTVVIFFTPLIFRTFFFFTQLCFFFTPVFSSHHYSFPGCSFLKAGSHVRRNDASISESARKRTCEPERRKHKRKRKKKEIFPFSCAYAYACVVESYVWTSLNRALHLAL